MNSCMRQTGSMNLMRNNFTPKMEMNCPDMEQKKGIVWKTVWKIQAMP